MLVMDASLLADNLHFVKTREDACKDMSIREITRAMVRATYILQLMPACHAAAAAGAAAAVGQQLLSVIIQPVKSALPSGLQRSCCNGLLRICCSCCPMLHNCIVQAGRSSTLPVVCGAGGLL
jgi:hypothetical protein